MTERDEGDDMRDDVWRQLAHDNPGMATRYGAAMREVLPPAEAHELIDALFDVGLLWSPPLDITRAEAEEIKARFLAITDRRPVWLDPALERRVSPLPAPRRRWWHRWIRP